MANANCVVAPAGLFAMSHWGKARPRAPDRSGSVNGRQWPGEADRAAPSYAGKDRSLGAHAHAQVEALPGSRQCVLADRGTADGSTSRAEVAQRCQGCVHGDHDYWLPMSATVSGSAAVRQRGSSGTWA